MSSEGFKFGDLVWAKVEDLPIWPARILEVLPDAKPPKSEKAQFVCFFGLNRFAWVLEKDITPHSESMFNDQKKSASYQEAIDELINFSKSNEENKISPPKKIKAVIQKEKEILPSVGEDTHMEIVPEMEIEEGDNENIPPSRRKSGKIPKKSQPKVVRVPKECASKRVVTKRFLDIKTDEEPSECTSPKNQKVILNEDPHGSNVASSSACNDELENCSGLVAHTKHVMPTPKRIGIIGLGHIGKALVCNLLKSGHDVTVYNKATYKCEVFVEIGAKKALSPAELIMVCDIIFCSVSDPEACKEIVFGDYGILKGLCEAEKTGIVHKGYVEMTSIDPEMSKEIHEMITKKGCKYLEAPVCGNSSEALEGTLLILASGNRDLFSECETCFCAIAKHAYFISCNVGFGSTLSILLNMFSGTVYAAAAEALTLAKRLGLPEDDFLSVLSEGPLQCRGVLETSKRMISSDFTTVTPLKHVQKDLSLTLALGYQVSQPMPITAAAYEKYMHADLLEYSENDVSAVYKKVRH